MAPDSSLTTSRAAMGKHFTAVELDLMHRLNAEGHCAVEIQRRVAKQRGSGAQNRVGPSGSSPWPYSAGVLLVGESRA